MAYKLNGKFVSKEKYEAAQVAEKHEETPVSEEVTPRKPRTVDPITSATARVRKAKRELDRVEKLHSKRAELPDLDVARDEYNEAVNELQDALNV